MRSVALAALALASAAALVPAQDRLKSMPGYARYQEVAKKIGGTLKSGSITVKWLDEGKSLECKLDGKNQLLDLATLRAGDPPKAEAKAESEGPSRGKRGSAGGGGPRERGRQFSSALSPDGKLKAFCRERNLWISDSEGKNEFAVTTDGSVEKRIKNAVASWVYGEELDQITAMWWSPDSKQVAFY